MDLRTGIFNIAGIRNDSLCIGNKEISVNAQKFCVDESVKTTIIEIQCTLDYAIHHRTEANGLHKQEWPD